MNKTTTTGSRPGAGPRRGGNELRAVHADEIKTCERVACKCAGVPMVHACKSSLRSPMIVEVGANKLACVVRTLDQMPRAMPTTCVTTT
jgi:hypothetical protein